MRANVQATPGSWKEQGSGLRGTSSLRKRGKVVHTAVGLSRDGESMDGSMSILMAVNVMKG